MSKSTLELQAIEHEDTVQGINRCNFGRTAEEHAQAIEIIDALLETTRGNEGHPLTEVLDYFTIRSRRYRG